MVEPRGFAMESDPPCGEREGESLRRGYAGRGVSADTPTKKGQASEYPCFSISGLEIYQPRVHWGAPLRGWSKAAPPSYLRDGEAAFGIRLAIGKARSCLVHRAQGLFLVLSLSSAQQAVYTWASRLHSMNNLFLLGNYKLHRRLTKWKSSKGMEWPHSSLGPFGPIQYAIHRA